MTNPTGGPKTQAGKEVARWNATRHGIRSPAPVIPGLEKAEDWEAHRDGVLESLSPEGQLELAGAGGASSAPLLAATPCDPLRAGDDSPLPREGGEGPSHTAPNSRRLYLRSVASQRSAHGPRRRQEDPAPPQKAAHASRREAPLFRRGGLRPLGGGGAGGRRGRGFGGREFPHP